MKICRLLNEIFSGSEKISKVLINIYFFVEILTVSAVIICVIMKNNLFPDYDTYLYTLNEILTAAVKLTDVFVIPVMLFELMYMKLGLKKTEE